METICNSYLQVTRLTSVDTRAMLRHMPKYELKTFQNTLWYCKEDIMLTGDRDRHVHNSDNLRLFTNVIKEKKRLPNSAKVFVRYWSWKLSNQA